MQPQVKEVEQFLSQLAAGHVPDGLNTADMPTDEECAQRVKELMARYMSGEWQLPTLDMHALSFLVGGALDHNPAWGMAMLCVALEFAYLLGRDSAEVPDHYLVGGPK